LPLRSRSQPFTHKRETHMNPNPLHCTLATVRGMGRLESEAGKVGAVAGECDRQEREDADWSAFWDEVTLDLGGNLDDLPALPISMLGAPDREVQKFIQEYDAAMAEADREDFERRESVRQLAARRRTIFDDSRPWRMRSL
jgi:hypothetical protein